MRNANEIYSNLQTIADELIQLSESGLIIMSGDSLNTQYSDPLEALRVAYDSVVKACEATQFMETVQPI